MLSGRRGDVHGSEYRRHGLEDKIYLELLAGTELDAVSALRQCSNSPNLDGIRAPGFQSGSEETPAPHI